MGQRDQFGRGHYFTEEEEELLMSQKKTEAISLGVHGAVGQTDGRTADADICCAAVVDMDCACQAWVKEGRKGE